MENRIFAKEGFPLFQALNAPILAAFIDNLLVKNREKIRALEKASKEYVWNHLIDAMEEMEEELNSVWCVLDHLNSVTNTDEITEIHDEILVKITEYHTELLQKEPLYLAVLSISEHPEFHLLPYPKKKIIENMIRDFKLSGITLSQEDKEKLKQLEKRLAECQSKFAKNVLEASNAWEHLISDAHDLKGLSTHTMTAFLQAAKAKGYTGWLVTLDYPSYYAVMTSAENRNLRQTVYEAYVTRASDLGDPTFDNTDLMYEILEIRHQLASLLGLNNFSEYSLTTKMVKEPQKVLSFLDDLVKHTKNLAQDEMTMLRQFAKETDNLSDIQPWDIGYYSEKLCQANCGVSQEMLREYFPQDKVLKGMFLLVEKLYGMTIKEIHHFESWHQDVQLFEIKDSQQGIRGYIYLDLYTRPHKRDGGWMLNSKNRIQKSDGSLQLPIAYIVTNFSKPIDNQPALFTHDEVLTLFHEWGHALHHVLTKIQYPSVSGCNGVEWDAIEVPSQLMEYWCWEDKVLPFISGHYKSQEALPIKLLEGIRKSKNFQIGMQIMRQLEFALFDFHLHLQTRFDRTQNTIQKILDSVRENVSVTPILPSNRFQHTFTHIFGGGYAAGYYSYKWAEVLASDIYAKFEEEGILNAGTGRAFLTTYLEEGGAKDAMELFTQFRGREPQIHAFLRHAGIVEQKSEIL